MNNETTSQQATVILHFRDNEPVAATISNGHSILYTVKEMTRAEQEEFYGVQKAQAPTQKRHCAALSNAYGP